MEEDKKVTEEHMPENDNETANRSSQEQKAAEIPHGTTYSWVNPKLQQNGGTEKAETGSDHAGQNQTAAGAEHMRQNQAGSGADYRTWQGQTGYGTDNRWQGQPQNNRNTWQPNQMHSNGQNGSGAGNTYSGWTQEKHKARKDRRTAGEKKKGGKSWLRVIAFALVFGVIAGGVTYGVNFLGNKIYPLGGSSSASIQKVETQVSDAGTADTDAADGSTAQSTDASGSLTVEEITENCMPSMVTISTMSVKEMQNFFGGTEQYTVEAAGSGIIVGQNDTELLIATNNHVVDGASQVSVGFVDESVVSASIRGVDKENDLAVVSVPLSDISDSTKSSIRVAEIGDSDTLKLGEQVVVIGNALGIGQSVTSGYVSALNRDLQLSDGVNTYNSTDLIQTDAAINSGNSGGAMLNMQGQLVGINEAKLSSASSGTSVDNMGYAIPISKAMPILQNLMTMEPKTAVSEDEMGYLGVTCANDALASQMAETYDLPEGVVVTSVLSGGPSEEAGMQKGDIITEIAGTKVTSYEEMSEELRYHKAGETISVVVQRADQTSYQEIDLEVTLGTKDVIQSAY